MPAIQLNVMTIDQRRKEPVIEIQVLLEQYYTYIRRLAFSILDDELEADDAAQETFIRAARALVDFRSQASHKTWLTSIALNVCRGILRQRKSRLNLRDRLKSHQPLDEIPTSPEGSLIENEKHHQLWSAVDSLDEKHRLPLILRYVHELSVTEIALSLGLPEGTVHSRLHHARSRLLKLLGEFRAVRS